MKRTLGWVVLGALVGACGGTERVVVAEPSTTASAQPAASASAQPAEVAGDDQEWGIVGQPNHGEEYSRVVQRVSAMVSDPNVVNGATRRGLGVVNVMWEDTGRAQNSALGPNISDLTLQVRHRERDGRYTTALMPVLRFPNFTDRTGDVSSDKFLVRVGNERKGTLRSVPLTDVLRDLRAFASVPDSIKGSGNLLAPRDSHFLVSAQAVFLPVPKQGKAEFNPVLFNYQSAPGSPAVLTLLVTRQGTSVSVIENRAEDVSAGGRGQELYFNNAGQRAAFTAERKSDVEARIAAQGGPKTQDDQSALARGADVLFVVQVPLKHANIGVLGGMPGGAPPPAKAGAAAAPQAAAPMAERSDVEQAVLGHGPNLGPYNEGRGLRLVRDPQFPIRITVQFYKATSNGVVSEQDLDKIAGSIGGVYEHADFVGSLVVPEGDPRRPTAWQKIPGEWFPW